MKEKNVFSPERKLIVGIKLADGSIGKFTYVSDDRDENRCINLNPSEVSPIKDGTGSYEFICEMGKNWHLSDLEAE